MTSGADETGLCLACGLCCDGTLFRDVELADAAEAALLERAGVPVRRTTTKLRVVQPCPALGADCRCGVYAGRPARCRQFDCALLLAVRDGGTAPHTALRIIGDTRRLAERVRRLLVVLGGRDECLPLSRRFAAVRRAFDTGRAPDEEEALETYAELTLAVQRLQLRLREKFYP
ncbi:MAG: YkgJ family cysteine cluster protein [Limisphaerales bacterium]